MTAVSSFNRVLATVLQGDSMPWSAGLEAVDLGVGQELTAPGAAPVHLHFPTSALLVLLQKAPGGVEVPVAMVGNDGVLGLSALLGAGEEIHRAVVLQPGMAWRLPASALNGDGPNAPRWLNAAMEHLQALTAQMSQAALCRKHHPVEGRLCHWLLTALDRLPGQAVGVGLPALAPLLGASSGALAKAAKALEADGALVCEAQRLLVPDRSLLKARSCGCLPPAAGIAPPQPS